jgi:hypothetical protein
MSNISRQFGSIDIVAMLFQAIGAPHFSAASEGGGAAGRRGWRLAHPRIVDQNVAVADFA